MSNTTTPAAQTTGKASTQMQSTIRVEVLAILPGDVIRDGDTLRTVGIVRHLGGGQYGLTFTDGTQSDHASTDKVPMVEYHCAWCGHLASQARGQVSTKAYDLITKEDRMYHAGCAEAKTAADGRAMTRRDRVAR